jgi:hypothetical protein
MSTTADEYYIQDTTRTLAIARMIVSYQDAGGGTMQEYGNLNAALSTGVEVKTTRRDGSTVINDLTDGVPIVSNGHWARFCYDAQRLDWGAGEDLFVVRWTFEKAGEPILLEPGETLRMYIQDDLSLLTNHFALVQGRFYG